MWGLAIAAVTQLLYRYKDSPASWLFVTGTLLGGAYEYLCSVFTEVVFGAVFWDYSAIPFNLGGRINLLYCFFWGFAAIAWFKVLYPPISAMPSRSCLPAVRHSADLGAVRVHGGGHRRQLRCAGALQRPPERRTRRQQPRGLCLDEHYDNARMDKVYPKAVHTG